MAMRIIPPKSFVCGGGAGIKRGPDTRRLDKKPCSRYQLQEAGEAQSRAGRMATAKPRRDNRPMDGRDTSGGEVVATTRREKEPDFEI